MPTLQGLRRSCATLSILLLARGPLLIQGSAAEGGEASCPADGSSGASCLRPSEAGEGGRAGAGRWSGAKEPHGVPLLGDEALHVDLVAQEVEELKNVIKLSQERIELLTELQEALASDQHPLPLPDSRVRALREPMPLISDIASDVERAPTAVAEDFLISKAVIPSSEEVKFVKLLPTVNRVSVSSSSSSSSSALAMPTALVVAGQADGTVQLFTPQGELVLSFSAGHEQPVMHLAVSPSHEEHLVVTGDAGGSIRMHKIDVRQRRGQKKQTKKQSDSTDEKISQHLTPPLNVTAQLLRQMQMPEGGSAETPRITALAVASQGGSRYVLAGDNEGSVSMFLRNGTLRTRLEVTLSERGVDSLSTNVGGGVLFRSGEDWGYLDVQKMQARHVDYCPHHFRGGLDTIVLDSQTSSRVLATDKNGTVWVLGVKEKSSAAEVKEKRECWVETRFATRSRMDLASVRGFAIGLEQGRRPGEPMSMLALNMSHVSSKAKAGGGKSPGLIPPVATAAVVWRRARPPVRAWSVLRRSKEGDLLVFLSEDGKEVEIMELLMQVYQAPSVDSFGNFQMPVVAVAVVLVLGYQYMKQKGKGSGGGGLGGKKGLGNEDFVSALRNKRKLNELRSSKSKF